MDNNNNNNENPFADRFLDLTLDLPVIARKWLEKYGISEQEQRHYQLSWNAENDSLVFPIFNNDKELIYYQERYFGDNPRHPKYITHGSKTQQLGFINNPRFPYTCVLVEDFVSAIKVGRLVTCAPLLGASLDRNALKWLVGRFKQVRVWLDMDKASESLVEASRLVPAIPDVRSILTPLDPKEYTTDRIGQFLAESGIKRS